MIKLQPTLPGRVEVTMFSESPAIYLDHWALRKIASNQEWRARFLQAFKTRGTLFFSTVHLAELAGNNSESIESVRSLLAAIGPHWMVINVNPFEVLEREATWTPNQKAPHVGDFFFKQGDFLKRLVTGTVSLTHLVDMMGHAEREALVAQTEHMCGTMVESISRFREAYKKDKTILDTTFPDEGFNERNPMRYVLFQLMRRFTKDSFGLDTNHIRDFFHTAVPVAYANMVALDKHWHGQVQKLQLPPQFMRPFKESTMDAFFEVLEACPAVRSSAQPVVD